MAVFARPQTSASEAHEFVQGRVANLGLVLTCIGVAFVVMRVVAILAVDRPERLLGLSMVAHYLGVLASTTMWLAARTGTRGRTAVHAIEITGLAVTSSCYTVMATGIPQAFRPEMTVVLALGVFLLAHAVHVPSSWRWTATLGGTLAVPLFIGSWVILNPMDPRIVEASAAAAGSVQTSAASIIGIGMASVVTWWIVIVTTASAASAVIYGLRREVREALRLGQYTLEEKLGEGGMGTVYRARHAMLRRKAAIKLIKPERSGSDGSRRTNALQRFEREAHVTANLRSPHTIQLYDFGVSAEGAFYYVMELLDGVDLETAIEKYGPMPPERVVYLLRQVCESLAEAHAAGLVHRDIKPANIFLCRNGIRYDFVKVLDFGLVALGPESDEIDPKLTADGFAGTPAYVAPEMVSGRDVDGRADVYAIGCVAYWLLTGRPPFERETGMATILAHVNDPPPPLSTVTDAAIPEPFEALVLECLAKKPADRPSSAAELRRRLDGGIAEGWDQERAAEWWRIHEPTREPPSPAKGSAPGKVTKAFP